MKLLAVLEEALADKIQTYFDNKVGDVNWYNNDVAKKDVEDYIRECINDCMYSIKSTDEQIDNYLEEFEETYGEKGREEERKLIIDDMRTQDYLEASLWN